MEWDRARKYCQDLGAQLVEIDSSEENKAIIKEIERRGFHAQKKQFWLGLTDRRTEGKWVYESLLAEPLFENWAFGQPDDGGWFAEEDWAYIVTDSMWNDYNCNQKQFLQWTLNALCKK